MTKLKPPSPGEKRASHYAYWDGDHRQRWRDGEPDARATDDAEHAWDYSAPR